MTSKIPNHVYLFLLFGLFAGVLILGKGNLTTSAVADAQTGTDKLYNMFFIFLISASIVIITVYMIGKYVKKES